MAAFARPDNLKRQLQVSGLATVGIDSTDKFWQIVNDTWQEGSTTALGYKKVLLARLLKLFPELTPSRQQEAAITVSAFVDAYFENSRIDEHWRPVLKMLNSHQAIQVIIATDHYAETTNAIIKYLAEWGIAATSVLGKGKSNFFVANSADLGSHKDSSGFWETVYNTLQNKYDRILLIDDFGANEQSEDAYVQENSISKRQQKTLNMLNNVFLIPVECCPFTAGNTPIADLIAKSSIKTKQFIN